MDQGGPVRHGVTQAYGEWFLLEVRKGEKGLVRGSELLVLFS